MSNYRNQEKGNTGFFIMVFVAFWIISLLFNMSSDSSGDYEEVIEMRAESIEYEIEQERINRQIERDALRKIWEEQ